MKAAVRLAVKDLHRSVPRGDPEGTLQLCELWGGVVDAVISLGFGLTAEVMGPGAPNADEGVVDFAAALVLQRGTSRGLPAVRSTQRCGCAPPEWRRSALLDQALACNGRRNPGKTCFGERLWFRAFSLCKRNGCGHESSATFLCDAVTGSHCWCRSS